MIPLNQSFLCCIVSVCVIAVSGCQTVNTLEPAGPVAQRQMLDDKRITTDYSLGRKITIQGVNFVVGQEGFMRIQVGLMNKTRRSQNFTYRIEWLDEAGILIDLPTSSTRRMAIQGKETMSITATAPTDRARDFRMKFQE